MPTAADKVVDEALELPADARIGPIIQDVVPIAQAVAVYDRLRDRPGSLFGTGSMTNPRTLLFSAPELSEMCPQACTRAERAPFLSEPLSQGAARPLRGLAYPGLSC